jgi:hypothetical protein
MPFLLTKVAGNSIYFTIITIIAFTYSISTTKGFFFLTITTIIIVIIVVSRSSLFIIVIKLINRIKSSKFI